MTKDNKENDMICTGAIPPQVVMGMELYQAYLQGMMNVWQLYVNLTRINWQANIEKFKDNNES
jgi:hypothetical protein